MFSSFKAIWCTLSNRLWLSASLCIVDFKALLSKKVTICMCFELLQLIDCEEKDKFLTNFTRIVVISYENPMIWLLFFEFTYVFYVWFKQGIYLCFIKIHCNSEKQHKRHRCWMKTCYDIELKFVILCVMLADVNRQFVIYFKEPMSCIHFD